MEEKKAREILRITFIVTVIFCVLGLLVWGFKELSGRDHGHEIHDKDHRITQEEAKQKILQEFSKVLQENPEDFKDHLVFYAKKTNYLETKNASIREVSEFAKKELERNYREIYSSLPKTSQEMQEGIERCEI